MEVAEKVALSILVALRETQLLAPSCWLLARERTKSKTISNLANAMRPTDPSALNASSRPDSLLGLGPWRGIFPQATSSTNYSVIYLSSHVKMIFIIRCKMLIH